MRFRISIHGAAYRKMAALAGVEAGSTERLNAAIVRLTNF
jgi:hypothetical protein